MYLSVCLSPMVQCANISSLQIFLPVFFQDRLMFQSSAFSMQAHRRTWLRQVLRLLSFVRILSATLWISLLQCLTGKLTLTTVQCSTHRLATQSTLQSLFLSGLRTRLAVLIRCMKSTRRKLTFSTVSSILQSFSRVLLFPRTVQNRSTHKN